jgi:hypothetical protein
VRLPNQIRAAACIAWVGVLGSATYFARESRPSRAGVIRERTAGGPMDLSAQDAPSRPGNGEPTTGESLAASAGSPGFASESRIVPPGDSPYLAGVARSHGVRHAPLPVQPMSLLKEAGRGSYLRQMATDAAALCGVPVAIFHALIERESSWRPFVVSRSGAVGLAQVKPSTGRGLSPGLDVRDPWQNLLAGACYLRRQYDRFGTWPAALHAYRVGPNARPSKVARQYAADIMQGSAR